MKIDAGAALDQFISQYARLPLAHKIVIPLLIVGTMAAIIFVSRWASRPDYQTLYSNLDEADAARVVEFLRDQKISYELGDGGRTIRVTPPSIVHDVKLDLAASGVPSGGTIGFELFNESALGRTGFVEQIMKVRALQGELERTIKTIDAVRNVRVHITSPKPSVFQSRDVLPTASVLLRLKAGAQIERQQVRAIANLVASAVERLVPENVTILDTAGNQLNDRPEDAIVGGADVKRLEYQRSVEQLFQRRVETMLNEVLGPRKAVARVTAALDFSKFEKEEELFDPAGIVPRSERSVAEQIGGGSDGGVVGVLSNLTNQPELLAPPGGGASGNARNETVRNYEVSRSVSRTVAEAGKLMRLTVAVLVDGQYSNVANDEGQVTRQYAPLSSEMMSKIENLVKQAVGFDTTRGDIITVENIQFFEPDESLEEIFETSAMRDLLINVGAWVLPALFMLLFFFLIVRPLVRFLINPTDAEVDLSRLLPSGIEELEVELEAERDRTRVLPQREPTGVDIQELEGLLADNSRMVKENPQQAALLIRYWLNEGRMQ